MLALCGRMKTPRVIDLTQPLGPATALWPGSKPFEASIGGYYDTHGMYFRNLALPEHSGTHFDAPSHFFDGGAHVDAIPAKDLVAPAARIDVRDLVGDDAGFALTAQQIVEHEREFGELESGNAALVCTGWDRYVNDPDTYLGRGVTAFPGLAKDAADLLVERGVVGVGIDTLGVDPGYSTDFPVHHTTLPAGLWHLEGLINLGEVPERGSVLVVGALSLVEGSGTPARVFALLSD